MLSDHRYLRWMLHAPVMTAVGALVVIGPAMAAEAQSSAPRTNVLANASVRAGSVTLETEQARVDAADRDLLINVRLAGLWEIPAGKMAMEKGASPRVRQIGQMIASQHVRLDTLAKKAATELGAELPNRPTMQQIRWLDQMKDADGAAFDDLFVHRLRVAHGKIFPVIAAVRTGTKNDVVRELAQTSNNFVLTHLTLLESTGLVRYEEMPKPADPASMTTAATAPSESGVLASPVIWAILATALIAGAILTTRMIRPQSFGGRPNEHLQRGPEYPIGTRSTAQPADDFYPQQGLRLSGGARSRS